MTTTEQAELRVLLRWVKALAGVAVLSLFGAGLLWAAFKDLPEKVDSLEARDQLQEQALTDLVLLQCADSALDLTKRRICARYEPRMPR